MGGRDMRTSIIDAAARLFAEKGYNATSVREVVEAAGCRKPALYYYFDNKEDLFLQILRRSCSTLDAVVRDALAQPGTVYDRLQRALHAYLGLVRRNETCLRLWMTAERHPEKGQPFFDFDALRQGHIDIMRGVMEKGVQSGELRAGIDIDEAVLGLLGMVDHRLVLSLHGRPVPDDYPERLLDLIFNGVGACHIR